MNFPGSPFQIFVGARHTGERGRRVSLTVDRCNFSSSCAIIRGQIRGTSTLGEEIGRRRNRRKCTRPRLQKTLVFHPLSKYHRRRHPIFISPIREFEEFATDGNRTFRESVTSLSISTFLSIKGRRIYGRVGDRGGRI